MFEESYLEKVQVAQAAASKIRLLPFTGAKNFRDLGGYQTLDGRTIRWNLLYRSDTLHKLSETDLNHLSASCLTGSSIFARRMKRLRSLTACLRIRRFA